MIAHCSNRMESPHSSKWNYITRRCTKDERIKSRANLVDANRRGYTLLCGLRCNPSQRNSYQAVNICKCETVITTHHDGLSFTRRLHRLSHSQAEGRNSQKLEEKDRHVQQETKKEP